MDRVRKRKINTLISETNFDDIDNTTGEQDQAYWLLTIKMIQTGQ